MEGIVFQSLFDFFLFIWVFDLVVSFVNFLYIESYMNDVSICMDGYLKVIPTYIMLINNIFQQIDL
jgi:hypothetical protein